MTLKNTSILKVFMTRDKFTKGPQNEFGRQLATRHKMKNETQIDKLLIVGFLVVDYSLCIPHPWIPFLIACLFVDFTS